MAFSYGHVICHLLDETVYTHVFVITEQTMNIVINQNFMSSRCNHTDTDYNHKGSNELNKNIETTVNELTWPFVLSFSLKITSHSYTSKPGSHLRRVDLLATVLVTEKINCGVLLLLTVSTAAIIYSISEKMVCVIVLLLV